MLDHPFFRTQTVNTRSNDEAIAFMRKGLAQIGRISANEWISIFDGSPRRYEVLHPTDTEAQIYKTFQQTIALMRRKAKEASL